MLGQRVQAWQHCCCVHAPCSWHLELALDGGISLGLRHLGNERLFHVGTVVQHHFLPPTCCSRELQLVQSRRILGVVLPVPPGNFCKELAYGILLLCEERVNLSPVGQPLGFEGVHKGRWSLAMWHQVLIPNHSYPINVKLGFIHFK